MKLTNIKSNDVTEKFGIVLICSSTDLKADVFLAGWNEIRCRAVSIRPWATEIKIFLLKNRYRLFFQQKKEIIIS